MEASADRLPEILEALGTGAEVTPGPGRLGRIDLISFGHLGSDDLEPIRKLQHAVRERHGVDLGAVGGRPGCSRIRFERRSPNGESEETVKQRVYALLIDPAFREQASELGFRIALMQEPYARVELRSGAVEGFYDDEAPLLFCSYCRKDADYQKEFEQHLAVLRLSRKIRDWRDGEIPPGHDWNRTIKSRLDDADLVAFLMSAAFYASGYIQGTELAAARRRKEAGLCELIPVLVRNVAFEEDPFLGSLQVLPRSRIAIASAENRDDAWTEVVREIARVADRRRSSRR